MVFNINDYDNGKFAMHCKTEDEAISFCNYLHSLGKTWHSGAPYNTNSYYSWYLDETCYDFMQDAFQTIRYCKDFKNYTILEWSDFMKDTVEDISNKDITKFSKEDLQTGDIILRRNHKTAIFIKEFNTFVSATGYSPLEDYTEDLRFYLNDDIETSGYDIIQIRRPLKQPDVQLTAFDCDFGELIYDRGVVKEMTLEEIEKELGYKIRIKN